MNQPAPYGAGFFSFYSPPQLKTKYLGLKGGKKEISRNLLISKNIAARLATYAKSGKFLIYIAANQVTVTIAIVNLGYVGEELRALNPLQGEGCLHSAIGV